MNIKRAWIAFAISAASALVMSFALAAPASAAMVATTATECRDYDRYPMGGGSWQPGRFCVAHAAEYPNYKGWGAMDRMCGGLFPADYDDVPFATCAGMRSYDAWKWANGKWSHVYVQEGKVYIYPFSGKWRWVYQNATQGWVAIDQEFVRITWFDGLSSTQ